MARQKMGCFAHLAKIDKNCFWPYVVGVAYPKQQPGKVSRAAGISLPTDLKEAASRVAATQDRSLSSVVRGLLKEWLQKTGEGLESAAKPKLTKAKSSVKKRR
jgi:hypothetical protein